MRPKREWRLRSSDSSDNELIDSLCAETGLSALAVRVCVQRGMKTAGEIQSFLAPRLESLTDPMRIRDMDRAVERLSAARSAGDRIRVYADYDVDGTSGAALLGWVFREMGFQFDVVQPDRFRDGYGLNVHAVEQAASEGVKVLLTVDCGITSFDAAERARDLGIDLIVVDHHQVDPERGLPPGHAIVDPQRADCESGLRQLCGCGLAFYLSVALRARGRRDGWFADGLGPNLKMHLDLVVIATAADLVPLTGDNRILVRHGMEILERTRKPGVRALMEVAGLTGRKVSPGSLGFSLGPRINASGRMQSASTALELLMTQNAIRAVELAAELERLNRERAELQNRIWDEVRVRIQRGLAEGKFSHGIVVADPEWHEGVVGIVASRVTEMFHRPAVVISLREDYGKGSVRSYRGHDVLAALRASADTLRTFGGHKYAAGLSVERDRVEDFTRAFNEALARSQEEVAPEALLLEGSCRGEELDLKALQEIERLAPFGPGNPEPVFSVRASVREHRILKDKHLKLNLSPVGSEAHYLEAIWFNATELDGWNDTVRSGESFEWAGVPEVNRFRGSVTPTFRIRDQR